MIYTIKKGKHYAQPKRLGIWFGTKEITRDVVFTPSCRYNINPADQGDTNKLFGAGHFFGVFRPAGVKWWELWNYQHKNSARFGWHYNPMTDNIVLSAYVYVDKQRYIISMGGVQIGKRYRLRLLIMDGTYIFQVYEAAGILMYKEVVHFPNNLGLMYLTGLYFGGNISAPHDIYVTITNPT